MNRHKILLYYDLQRYNFFPKQNKEFQRRKLRKTTVLFGCPDEVKLFLIIYEVLKNETFLLRLFYFCICLK